MKKLVINHNLVKQVKIPSKPVRARGFSFCHSSESFGNLNF